ncbi:hypothetical protein DFJ74DRAFT_733918 [Hyaloraphidium curvatum]|nr:hypothetical protein DFJ74DRAFT_733918 [Hyaloraphidium curvatum]
MRGPRGRLGGMFTAAALAVAIALFAGPNADASPTPVEPRSLNGTGPHVLFRRLCSQCPEDYYCEFGFQGTPPGQLACVGYSKGRAGAEHLYRRTGSATATASETGCTGPAAIAPTLSVVGFAASATASFGNTVSQPAYTALTVTNLGSMDCTIVGIYEDNSWRPDQNGNINVVEDSLQPSVISGGQAATFSLIARITAPATVSATPGARITITATAATPVASDPYVFYATATVSKRVGRERHRLLRVSGNRNLRNRPHPFTNLGNARVFIPSNVDVLGAETRIGWALGSPDPKTVSAGGTAIVTAVVKWTATTGGTAKQTVRVIFYPSGDSGDLFLQPTSVMGYATMTSLQTATLSVDVGAAHGFTVSETVNTFTTTLWATNPGNAALTIRTVSVLGQSTKSASFSYAGSQTMTLTPRAKSPLPFRLKYTSTAASVGTATVTVSIDATAAQTSGQIETAVASNPFTITVTGTYYRN